MTENEILTQAVRESECVRCRGFGFKIKADLKTDCPDCQGNGIHLQKARAVARELRSSGRS